MKMTTDIIFYIYRPKEQTKLFNFEVSEPNYSIKEIKKYRKVIVIYNKKYTVEKSCWRENTRSLLQLLFSRDMK